MVRALAALAAVVLLLAACGSDEPSGEPAAIDGVTWELTSGTVDGDPLTVPDGHRVTLLVEDLQVSGTSACNTYFGEFLRDGDRVGVGQIGATEMACDPPEVMDTEQAFLGALSRVERAARTVDRLVLIGPGVELAFAAQPPVPNAELVGTTWELDTLIDGDAASTVAGDPATLVFRDDGTFEAGTGCRFLTGRYVVNGDEVATPEMAATGECPGDLSQQDDHVVAVIGDGFRVQIDGQRLTLTAGGDKGLAYRPR